MILQKIRITKEFTFEMAHALADYDGPCKNIHGHSYILRVTVIGIPLNDASSPKNGMVLDFGILKAIVKKEIVDILDHALVLAEDSNLKKLDILKQVTDNIVLLPYQPTCENMIIDFAERLKKSLPPTVSLKKLLLHETATSFAEWYSEDN